MLTGQHKLPAVSQDSPVKKIVEAVLFAAAKPMTVKQLQNLYPKGEAPSTAAITQALNEISQDYLPRPIGLQKLASGYCFQVRCGYSYWLTRLFAEKPPNYSHAVLETIAIIAYRQPVTRGDIEDIRGVGVSSNIIRTLLEREWIKVLMHRQTPGRPAVYGTTKQFLDHFNLASLAQLPSLQEVLEKVEQLDTQITPDKIDHANPKNNNHDDSENASHGL